MRNAGLPESLRPKQVKQLAAHHQLRSVGLAQVAEFKQRLAKLQADLSAAKPTPASDAVSALVNLGYGQTQAGAAVSAAMRKAGEDAPTERLIRLALKELALV